MDVCRKLSDRARIRLDQPCFLRDAVAFCRQARRLALFAQAVERPAGAGGCGNRNAFLHPELGMADLRHSFGRRSLRIDRLGAAGQRALCKNEGRARKTRSKPQQRTHAERQGERRKSCLQSCTMAWDRRFLPYSISVLACHGERQSFALANDRDGLHKPFRRRGFGLQFGRRRLVAFPLTRGDLRCTSAVGAGKRPMLLPVGARHDRSVGGGGRGLFALPSFPAARREFCHRGTLVCSARSVRRRMERLVHDEPCALARQVVDGRGDLVGSVFHLRRVLLGTVSFSFLLAGFGRLRVGFCSVWILRQRMRCLLPQAVVGFHGRSL